MIGQRVLRIVPLMLIGNSTNLCFSVPDISEAQQVPFDETARPKEQRRLYNTTLLSCMVSG
jgi:hypothetical protein